MWEIGFSGMNSKNFITSRAKDAKGIISTIAKIMYSSFRNIMNMTHFVQSFYSVEAFVPIYSSWTVR